MQKSTNIRKLALIAMLGALAAALHTFRFPLPFAPSFLDFDIAELPGLFAGFFLGPVAGTLVIVVKIGLKLLLQGTNTAFVGDFSNFFQSMMFMLPAALIYKKMHSKKGAIIGMVTGTLITAVFAIFSNTFVMFPMYSELYGLPMDVIIGMGSAVNPFVHDMFSMMVFSIFPFNLVKFGVTSVLTYLIYKRVGNTLRNMVAPKNTAAQPAK